MVALMCMEVYERVLNRFFCVLSVDVVLGGVGNGEGDHLLQHQVASSNRRSFALFGNAREFESQRWHFFWHGHMRALASSNPSGGRLFLLVAADV